MSQFFIATTMGNVPVPPQVPTSFTTQNGTATPSANNLLVKGFSSTSNNINGISTAGGTPATSNSNEVDVLLTNRITGQVTTSNAGGQTQTLYTFPLGTTPGTYLFFTRVVAFNTTDGFSAAYTSFRCVRTTGAAGVLISATTAFDAEEQTFTDSEVVNGVSGNNATITVTGINNKTIDWLVVTEYQFVS